MTLIFLFFSSALCFSQDLPYARYVLDSLCSPYMHGRGYVSSGEKLAADFIAGEYQQHGLLASNEGYFQFFEVPVNTHPGELALKLDGKTMEPGIDFLIDPGTPSFNGEYGIVNISEDVLLEDRELVATLRNSVNKFIAVSPAKKQLNKDQKAKVQEVLGYLRYSDDNPAKGTIIYSGDKLTWHGSTRQFSKPTIIFKNDGKVKARKISLAVESKFIERYKTQNVVGYIPGTSNPDSLIVLTAHYDHLGRMGRDTYFPGANDNASGVALLLNLAKYYSENRPGYSVLFIAFGAEEIGLQGAKYYTDNPLFPLDKIKFLLNFDISGTGDDGIQVVNGSVYKEKFDLMVKLNEEGRFLKQIKIRGEACNSDHCMFHLKGVPCFFIYTLGGIQAYHDVFDKAETLPFTEFENYFRLIIKFLERI